VKELSGLVQRLRLLKPWAVVALLLASALVGYSAYLGARYWGLSRQVAAMDGELSPLSTAGRRLSPSETALAAQLAQQQQRLGELSGLFSFGKAGDVTAVVAATAKEAAVTLASVALGEPQPKVVQGIRYQAQPVAVGLVGKEADVVRFLSLFQEKLPSASITSLQMTSMETAPSAQVQFLVLLSPEPVPEKTPQPTPDQGKVR